MTATRQALKEIELRIFDGDVDTDALAAECREFVLERAKEVSGEAGLALVEQPGRS